MKAIQFKGRIPAYIFSKALGKFSSRAYYGRLSNLQLIEKNSPSLPGSDWVRIKPYYGGICGSDLNLIFLHDSPYTSPFVSFPFIMGHENCGTILEVGQGVRDLGEGMRVVADPLLSCVTRGFKNKMCPPCKNNNESRCLNFRKGDMSPGLLIGTCRDTGGSWSEEFVAHKDNVHILPENVSWETGAIVDSFASAIHPVVRYFPDQHERVLIIGGGPVGLCTLFALRALGFEGHISILVKYDFQERISRQEGASEIIYLKEGYKEELSKIFQMEMLSPIIGERVPVGGPEIIYDCIGSSSSIKDSITMAGPGARVILVGLASFPRGIDWTPIWLKELSIHGIFAYSTERLNSQWISTYALAIKLVQEQGIPLSNLLTHTFTLDEYKKALQFNLNKGEHGLIKSAFKIN